MKRKNVFLGIAIWLLSCVSAYGQPNYPFEVNGLWYFVLDNPEEAEVIPPLNNGDKEYYSGGIVIPEFIEYEGRGYKVTQVGSSYSDDQGAFTSSNLNSIDLGGITTIKDAYLEFPEYSVYPYPVGMFSGCKGLKRVDLKNVKHVGSMAFSDCANLQTVIFRNVETIGGGTFYHCNKLESIDLGPVKQINAAAEGACPAPHGGQGTVYYGTFDGCSNIHNVNLQNVQSIGSYAFRGCPNIKLIKTTSTKPPFVGENAFDIATYNSVKVLVPQGCLDTYKKDAYWSQFTNIEEINQSSTIRCNLNVQANEGGSVYFGNNVVSNNLITDIVYQGDVVTLDFDLNKGYCVKSLKVNGLEVKDGIKNGKYSFVVTAETSVVVVFDKSAIVIDDKIGTYTNTADQFYSSIQYVRDFKHTKWQALYVPFDINYEDWKDQFEVAYLNDVHQFDDDSDGWIDRTQLEVIYIRNGKINANTPYMIKAKDAGLKTISLTNTTLKAAAVNSLDCSSTRVLFTFIGTNTGIYLGSSYYLCYALGDGKLIQSDSKLNGFRWYLQVEDRTGIGYNAPKAIQIVEKGNDITGLENIQSEKKFDVYDLNGRLVKKGVTSTRGLRKGIYIINGNKVVL